VVAGLRGASPWLEQQFDRAAEEAERSISVRASMVLYQPAEYLTRFSGFRQGFGVILLSG
jgi:hypothetical protein